MSSSDHGPVPSLHRDRSASQAQVFATFIGGGQAQTQELLDRVAGRDQPVLVRL